MFLDRTLFGGSNQGTVVFFGEFRGHLDFQLNGAHHAAAYGIANRSLHDANAVGGQAALFAETQNVDPSASAER